METDKSETIEPIEVFTKEYLSQIKQGNMNAIKSDMALVINKALDKLSKSPVPFIIFKRSKGKNFRFLMEDMLKTFNLHSKGVWIKFYDSDMNDDCCVWLVSLDYPAFENIQNEIKTCSYHIMTAPYMA